MGDENIVDIWWTGVGSAGWWIGGLMWVAWWVGGLVAVRLVIWRAFRLLVWWTGVGSAGR